jgi:hypothetical protein
MKVSREERFITPPGDRELYKGELRLTRPQRISVAVYAIAGIGVAVACFVFAVMSFGDGGASLVPAAYYVACGLLVLVISMGIVRNSVLRKRQSTRK